MHTVGLISNATPEQVQTFRTAPQGTCFRVTTSLWLCNNQPAEALTTELKNEAIDWFIETFGRSEFERLNKFEYVVAAERLPDGSLRKTTRRLIIDAYFEEEDADF